MQLILIRHGIAEDREDFAKTGRDDRLRPLTSKGRVRFHKMARGLKFHYSDIDHFVTSPLTRAIQSLEMIKPLYPMAEVSQVPELVPEASPGPFLKWLQAHPNLQRVAIVGHEPHLSQLAVLLLAEQAPMFVHFKKAGVMVLEIEDLENTGRAQLKAFLPPRILRDHGELSRKS